jgi:outer membrane immunogenic protein
MRSIALAIIVLLGAATGAACQAQSSASVVSGDAALTYHWERSNTQPGDCGCFYLNGGGLSGSLNVRPRLAVVAEVAAEYNGNGPSTGNSLTLTSFLAGARYSLPQFRSRSPHRLQPFLQILLGGAHAGGAIAGAGDGTEALTARMGGGVDFRLGSHFALRLIQADYNLTTFQNTVNNHQNNLLLGTGVVYRWSTKK